MLRGSAPDLYKEKSGPASCHSLQDRSACFMRRTRSIQKRDLDSLTVIAGLFAKQVQTAAAFGVLFALQPESDVGLSLQFQPGDAAVGNRTSLEKRRERCPLCAERTKTGAPRLAVRRFFTYSVSRAPEPAITGGS